ncbi:MAG: hypothetical protein OES32_04325 [Acidobacteriota bacterium]|nr:hypothetical protein [Acidobacteriota bacterium]
MRGLVGVLAALVLFGSSTDLHSSSAGLSAVVTSTPVLAGSDCGAPCAHFDRHQGKLLPEHPTARLNKQPSLAPEAPAWLLALSVTPLARPTEPPTREQLFHRLPPPRGPPSV